MTFGRRIGRVIVAIVRPVVHVLFPFTCVHREKLRNTQGPLVLCCNHISMVDPVFLMLASRRHVYFMGKEELFHNRFFGWFLKTFLGVFPVSRGKGDSTAIETAFSILERGDILGIFPEGTRSKDGTLGKAKSGTALIAAKMQAPICPCAVVTKNGRVKLFQRSTLVIGDILTPSQLHLDGEKPDLRYASRAIMAEIAQMIEENRT